MTCYDREPARSTMDLPLETAAARMRDLQGEIARSRVTDREHDDILHRLRADRRPPPHRARLVDRASPGGIAGRIRPDRRQPLTATQVDRRRRP